MTTRTARLALLTTIAAGALVLSACGGSSSSSDSSSASPIGGGSAACDQATLEGLSQEAATAAGSTWVSFKSVECVDGWALVFGITKTGDIEQTTAFAYQAEGPNWALKQQDVICGDGPDDGIPASLKDQLCALR